MNLFRELARRRAVGERSPRRDEASVGRPEGDTPTPTDAGLPYHPTGGPVPVGEAEQAADAAERGRLAEAVAEEAAHVEAVIAARRRT